MRENRLVAILLSRTSVPSLRSYDAFSCADSIIARKLKLALVICIGYSESVSSSMD